MEGFKEQHQGTQGAACCRWIWCACRGSAPGTRSAWRCNTPLRMGGSHPMKSWSPRGGGCWGTTSSTHLLDSGEHFQTCTLLPREEACLVAGHGWLRRNGIWSGSVPSKGSSTGCIALRHWVALRSPGNMDTEAHWMCLGHWESLLTGWRGTL